MLHRPTRPSVRRILAIGVVLAASVLGTGCVEEGNTEGTVVKLPTDTSADSMAGPADDTGTAVSAQGNGTNGNLVYVPGPVVAPATKSTTYRLEVYGKADGGKPATTMICYYGTYRTTAAKHCAEK